MADNELHETAKALVAEGKGILAADESTGTIKKRFDSIDLESTEDRRRAYRDMLFTTPGVEDYISGVILFDETIRQSHERRHAVPGAARQQGHHPRHQGRQGRQAARAGRRARRSPRASTACASGSTSTASSAPDSPSGAPPTRSPTSCRATTASGPTPTRWRATRRSARRPAWSRSSSPRCSRTGRTRSSAATTSPRACSTPSTRELFDQRVDIAARCSSRTWCSPATRRRDRAGTRRDRRLDAAMLYKHVPAAVPGIVFLSGGQSDEDATANLNAMNAEAPTRGSSRSPTAARCRRRRSRRGAARTRTSRRPSAPTTTAPR